MVVKRIAPLSLAKVSGLLYAILGLVLGCFFALFAMLGLAASPDEGGPILGMLFGVGAIIFLPLFYGVIGFVSSLLMAALYNVVARAVGGVELEMEGAGSP